MNFESAIVISQVGGVSVAIAMIGICQSRT